MLRNLKFFVFILIVTNVTPAISQDIILGINYGFGSARYTRNSDNLKTNRYSLNRGALVIEFSPFYSNLFIRSGLEYQTNKLGNSLSVPLTIRLAFGKKIRPFFEGGGYFVYDLSDNQDQYIVKTDIGTKAGFGILYLINKRWRLDAGYFHRFGFKTGLEEEIILPLEQVQVEKYRLSEGSFEFGMKYRF